MLLFYCNYVEACILYGSLQRCVVKTCALNNSVVVFQGYAYAGYASDSLQCFVYCCHAMLAVHAFDRNSFSHDESLLLKTQTKVFMP